MSADRLQKALQGLPLGPVHYFASLGSTNDEAAIWAAEGAPHLALVVADEQTAGKGRSGRRWLTPPGSALAFSLILRPQPIPADEEKPGASSDPLQRKPGTAGNAFYLPGWAVSRLAALGTLAVSMALQAVHGLTAQIKWPNDVLLDGKKVAGVLVETSWEGERLASAILGIGINVANDSIVTGQSYRFPPISVESALGKQVDRWPLLAATLLAILDWSPRLASAEFLACWQDRLAYRGERVQVFREAEAAVEGRLAGLDRDGSLILLTEDGHRLTLHSGEMHLRPVNR